MGLRSMDPFPLPVYPLGIPALSENFPSEAPDDTPLLALIQNLSAMPLWLVPERQVLLGVHRQRCQSGAVFLVSRGQPLQQWGRQGRLKTMASAYSGLWSSTASLHQCSGSSQPSVASWWPLPSQLPCSSSPHLLWLCCGHLSSSLDPLQTLHCDGTLDHPT